MILFIIAFFFFLGCPFEFVRCYLNRNDKNDDDDDFNYDFNKREEEENKPLIWSDYLIIFLLIILGIFLQPLYLLFYLLMAMMEAYKSCGCFMFWAYSN